jgi:hypothetical protein
MCCKCCAEVDGWIPKCWTLMFRIFMVWYYTVAVINNTYCTGTLHVDHKNNPTEMTESKL